MTIKFWGANNRNGFLSNFYLSSFSQNGRKYKTVEHWFQSYKFMGTKYETYIRNLETPQETAKEGKRRDLPLREDWEEVKEAIMYNGLRLKFKQNSELMQLLLDTGDEELIEASPYDYYWGAGFKQTGKNRLGVLLMRLREEFRENKDNSMV